jgi:hypothetical protein
MTEPRRTSARAGTTGMVLQVLLGLALVADLVFLGFLGMRLSDRVEQTGVALAGGLTLLLIGVLFRLTRRIGSGAQAVVTGGGPGAGPKSRRRAEPGSMINQASALKSSSRMAIRPPSLCSMMTRARLVASTRSRLRMRRFTISSDPGDMESSRMPKPSRSAA